MRTVTDTLNAELNPIRHLLALVGARHIVHVSRMRVKSFAYNIRTDIILAQDLRAQLISDPSYNEDLTLTLLKWTIR